MPRRGLPNRLQGAGSGSVAAACKRYPLLYRDKASYHKVFRLGEGQAIDDGKLISESDIADETVRQVEEYRDLLGQHLILREQEREVKVSKTQVFKI